MFNLDAIKLLSLAVILFLGNQVTTMAAPFRLSQSDTVMCCQRVDTAAHIPVTLIQSTPPDPFELALKTNLLFDAVTALNIEIEVPINKRWSVLGEWIFPWWTFDNGKSDSNRRRFQLLNCNLEGRYWLGNRTIRKPLTGYFGGFYAGAGLFDFEWNRKGYQGEFFIAAGISGGYAHSIAKNLRLEYSLGIGYMKIRYNSYESVYGGDQRWHAMRQESGRQSWFGPTRAKVSLVWMIHYPFKIHNPFKKGGIR